MPDVPPIRLVGLCGSLRRASTNLAILRAAEELAPDGVEVVVHPLHDVPLYDADLEVGGMPEAAQALRAAVAGADGLLLATPEHNWSVTAALKSAIDWLSRGPEAPIDRLPAALLSGAGGSGGKRAQSHLRDILGHNEVDVLDASVQIARVWQHVEDGRLTTPEHRDEVAAVVAALADRVRARRTLDGRPGGGRA